MLAILDGDISKMSQDELREFVNSSRLVATSPQAFTAAVKRDSARLEGKTVKPKINIKATLDELDKDLF